MRIPFVLLSLYRPNRVPRTRMFERLNAVVRQQTDLVLVDDGSDSYPMQATNNSGYMASRPNPYAQQDEHPNNYSSAPAANSTTQLTAGGDSMSQFYSEVRTPRFSSIPPLSQ